MYSQRTDEQMIKQEISFEFDIDANAMMVGVFDSTWLVLAKIFYRAFLYVDS